MVFLIATPNTADGGLRTSSFEDASDVPEPGADVVVSLPEKGTHVVGRVSSVDAGNQIVYLDVDEENHVWS